MTIINDLFYSLIESKEVVLALSKGEYESMRVQLTRKLTRYKQEMSACGFLADWIRDSSLKASYSPDGEATYKLGSKRKQKEYTILRTGNSDEQETPTVRTNLECDQELQVRDLDGDSDSSQHAADADSSSAQGESNALCNSPQDWRTDSWTFGDGNIRVSEESGLPDNQIQTRMG